MDGIMAIQIAPPFSQLRTHKQRPIGLPLSMEMRLLLRCWRMDRWRNCGRRVSKMDCDCGRKAHTGLDCGVPIPTAREREIPEQLITRLRAELAEMTRHRDALQKSLWMSDENI